MNRLQDRFLGIACFLLLSTQPSHAEAVSYFHTFLSKAQIEADQNHPDQALQLYQEALTAANKENNQVQARVANFGIARMQMWLGKYNEAEKTYKILYQVDLPSEDKEIALDGLIRSLNYQDKSQEAFSYLPNSMQINNLSLMISIAQTYVAQGNIDKAQTFLKQHELSLQKIVKDSPLDVQLKKLNTEIADSQVAAKQLESTPTPPKEVSAEGVLTEKINQAREYLAKENGKKAFEIIKPYIDNHRFDVYIIAGKSMAIMENPERSLLYFEKALPLSANQSDKKVTLFEIAKMQIWLERSSDARRTLDIIQNLSLSKAEKKNLNQLRAKIEVKAATTTANNNISRINRYLEANDGVRAFNLINEVYANEYNFTRYRLSAESMVAMNRPNKALEFYKKALLASTTKNEQKIALFGIAKLHLWIANYVRAERTFRTLLTYPLTPNEYQLALAGVVKSLAYYDRPRTAYKSIPSDLTYTTPQLVIAAGQATLWSDWADITKCILDTYKNLACQIDMKSSLGGDYLDLKWQTDLATASNVITPSYFVSHDSENFDKRKFRLDYNHYWNQIIQTSIGLESIKYTQNSPFQLNATGFYIGEILRPTRELLVRAFLQSYQYKNYTTGQKNNWNPVLWDLNANYIFNDYIAANIRGKREIVETFPAFNDEITDNLYTAGLNINPVPYVHLDGSVFQLSFSDKNRREGYFTSASVLFAPNIGLSLTGILRGYDDKFTSPDYFSPHRYMAESLVLKLARRLGATWHYYIDGGAGRQFISPFGSPTVSSPIHQWGTGINGPISNHFIFTAYYANSHQASGFINSPDYDYKYGEITLNIIL